MGEYNGAAVSVSTPAFQTHTHTCTEQPPHPRVFTPTKFHMHPFPYSALHLNSYYNTVTSLWSLSHMKHSEERKEAEAEYNMYLCNIKLDVVNISTIFFNLKF